MLYPLWCSRVNCHCLEQGQNPNSQLSSAISVGQTEGRRSKFRISRRSKFPKPNDWIDPNLDRSGGSDDHIRRCVMRSKIGSFLVHLYLKMAYNHPGTIPTLNRTFRSIDPMFENIISMLDFSNKSDEMIAVSSFLGIPDIFPRNDPNLDCQPTAWSIIESQLA